MSDKSQEKKACLKTDAKQSDIEESCLGPRNISRTINCWEYKNCGREPGGKNAGTLGICPAAIHTESNDINNGINAGRYCWKTAGTLCGGVVQGTYAQKLSDCINCDFYKIVQEQQVNFFNH